MRAALDQGFAVSVEVVPPKGPDPEALLERLAVLQGLDFWGFSVATNPVAKPRMSALAFCRRLTEASGRPAILHATTRDHNRLSLQSLLWGARALGIGSLLAASGDFVALPDRSSTTTVRDIDVLELVRLGRGCGLCTGVVIDPDPAKGGLQRAAQRLLDKVAAGAQFAVTQPVYDEPGADALAAAVAGCGVPVVLGILPLRTPRHAEFLHAKVAGIAVPEAVRGAMQQAADPVAAGVANARRMLALARQRFAGACLMPPFDHFEVLARVLAG